MESASRPATSGGSLFIIAKFPSALLRHHHWLAPRGRSRSAPWVPRGLTAQHHRRSQHDTELGGCVSKIKVSNVRGWSPVYTRKKYLREKPCHRTTLRLKASVGRHRNEDRPRTAVFTGWVLPNGNYVACAIIGCSRAALRCVRSSSRGRDPFAIRPNRHQQCQSALERDPRLECAPGA